MRRKIALLVIAAFALGATGCGLIRRAATSVVCGVEERWVWLYDPSWHETTNDKTFFRFSERTGDGRSRKVAMYDVKTRTIPRQAVTGVRLRAGTPDAPGVVLYDIPVMVHDVLPPAMPPFLIVSSSPANSYRGAVSFDRLWDLIDDPVFVELTLKDGACVGLELEIQERRDWHCFDTDE